jgi:hypothetical protein
VKYVHLTTKGKERVQIYGPPSRDLRGADIPYLAFLPSPGPHEVHWSWGFGYAKSLPPLKSFSFYSEPPEAWQKAEAAKWSDPKKYWAVHGWKGFTAPGEAYMAAVSWLEATGFITPTDGMARSQTDLSGLMCVALEEGKGWTVVVKCNKKTHYGGVFKEDDLESAIEAAKALREQLFTHANEARVALEEAASPGAGAG